MQIPNRYFFIDECGDPEFFGKGKRLLVGTQGYQPLLIIGMIETDNRKKLNKAVGEFSESILQDVLFKSIPSIKESNWFLHAKNDHPEIRAEFFKFLRKYQGIRFHAVIARKDLSIFNRKHNNNASEFYFDVIRKLLENHWFEDIKYHIYLAHKSKTTTEKLINSIEKAIEGSNKKKEIIEQIDYNCTIENSSFLHELSVVDYFLWALQRYIYKGESHFGKLLNLLLKTVIDLYDNNKLYDKDNPFRLQKASKFEPIL
jgi:virulence-associated protein VapD